MSYVKRNSGVGVSGGAARSTCPRRFHHSPPNGSEREGSATEALDLLASLAEADATETFRWVQEKTQAGLALEAVFNRMPVTLNDN